MPRQNALVGCFDVAKFERVVVTVFFGLIKSTGVGIIRLEIETVEDLDKGKKWKMINEYSLKDILCTVSV